MNTDADPLPKIGSISSVYVALGYVAAGQGIHENPFRNPQVPRKSSEDNWQRGHDDYMKARASLKVTK